MTYLEQTVIEKLSWEATSDKCVMFCFDTKTFHFICETEMLDENGYETLEDAQSALKDYASNL